MWSKWMAPWCRQWTVGAGGAKIFDLGHHDQFGLPGYESIHRCDRFFFKFLMKWTRGAWPQRFNTIENCVSKRTPKFRLVTINVRLSGLILASCCLPFSIHFISPNQLSHLPSAGDLLGLKILRRNFWRRQGSHTLQLKNCFGCTFDNFLGKGDVLPQKLS